MTAVGKLKTKPSKSPTNIGLIPKLTLGIKNPSIKRSKKAPTIASVFLRLSVKNGAQALPKVMRLLDQEKINLESVVLSAPTLDDVFLKKTGYSLRDINPEEGGNK